MSDETSLVSGRFTKLENGGVRVLVLLLVPGRDSRHRETRTIGSDGVCLVLDRLSARWPLVFGSRRRSRGSKNSYPTPTGLTAHVRIDYTVDGLREPNRRTRSDRIHAMCDGRSDADDLADLRQRAAVRGDAGPCPRPVRSGPVRSGPVPGRRARAGPGSSRFSGPSRAVGCSYRLQPRGVTRAIPVRRPPLARFK
jgi:hypothetical protein